MLAKIFEIFTKYSHVNTPIETRKVRLWPRKLKHIKYLPVQMIDIWVDSQGIHPVPKCPLFLALS